MIPRQLAVFAATLVAAGGLVSAQPELDFKKQIERGDYQGLSKKLAQYLDLNKADPKLRAYLELNLEYLRRGAKPATPGSELILFRGAKNERAFKMPETSGGTELLLPNSIRHMRSKWDARLPRINKYFSEATTHSGGQGETVHDLLKIMEHHKGGTLGKGANSTKSVLISTSTRPLTTFGPPFYILKVAPERAIFNPKSLSSEYEVLLPFWVLPHEIVAKVNTLEEVKNHPLYKQSRLKDVNLNNFGYNAGGNRSNWALIEENIRSGRGPLEGVAGLNAYFPKSTNLGPVADAEYLKKYTSKIEKRGGSVEYVPQNDLRLPKGALARTTMVDGKPRIYLREGKPIHKIALLDELTHIIQLESLIKKQGAAEAEKLLWKASLGDKPSRAVLLGWELRAKRMVRSLLAQGDPVRAEMDRAIKALEQERDPYLKYRRSDKTIDWKRAGKQLGGGLAHFTLALFLKELAVVAETRDPQRLNEFFAGLATTDFYVHYGLFSLGAAGGDAAYKLFLERHLAKFVKPTFVRSILRSNIGLAAGMALPDLVNGQFEGRTFAISLAGLGLSSTAVKTGVASLKWVANLKTAKNGTKIAATVAKTSKLANVGGWLYTVGETAVVLYFGDKISQAIDKRLTRREAEAKVRDAAEALIAAPADAAKADALAEAFREQRDLLAQPLLQLEDELFGRLGKLATGVKQSEDGLEAFRRSGPGARSTALEAAAERLRKKREAQQRDLVTEILTRYEQDRAAQLDAVYGTGKESRTAIPTDADSLEALRGTTGGTVFRRLGRAYDGRQVLNAISDLPTTRLAGYAHEAEVWEALAKAHAKDAERKAGFEARAARARELAAGDAAAAGIKAIGAAGALERS